MTPTLVQSAHKTVAKDQSRTCTVTFENPTSPGNLVVVAAVTTGGSAKTNKIDGDFEKAHSISTPNMHLTVWYEDGADSLTSVTVRSPADRAIQVRALEYAGVRQSGALDEVEGKVAPHRHRGKDVDSGRTGTLADSGQLVLSFVANVNASTTQFGFSGGLIKLFENTSSSRDNDDDRSRLSVHSAISVDTDPWRLQGKLSATREWIAHIITFRPGASGGPVRMTSRNAPNMLTVGGVCQLSAFGPFTSQQAPPMLSVGGSGEIAIFDYQYRLGPDRLLIGDGTDYDVVSIDGLEGWVMRTSDADQPRGDGAQRGVDLQSARRIVMVVEAGGDDDEVEEQLEELFRAISPQRDEDWRLEWRHPGRGIKFLNCRPVDVVRELDHDGTLLARQPIQLRAADPRHYSHVLHSIEIPVTPAGADVLTLTSVVNAGNSKAYPTIRIEGPTSGDTVTRVELGNITTNVTFVVEASLPSGAVLVGDMPARATGTSRPVVTLDDQSRYGAWAQPREAWFLDAAPAAVAGVNGVYLRTIPEGAPVRCFLDYFDTWSG